MKTVKDPRIHLGIDNCFAIKRWTEPDDWGRVVKELGLKYVEAVPDLECEPMLTTDDYRKDWIDKTNRMRDELGVQVVMFYSNDSTYDSIGFSHPDERVRRCFVDQWFGKFTDMAAAIGSDIGYYVQATPENLLYSPDGRKEAYEHAKQCMIDVNRMAGEKGIKHVVLEQMYTPHQPPFSIQGMEDLMKEITARSEYPFYFTEDVGHHCPLYIRPDRKKIESAVERYNQDGFISAWLGSLEALDIFTESAKTGKLSDASWEALEKDFDKNSDQFNLPKDTDCYSWLRRLGAWSPVVHMQQTDGTHSSHEAFLPANNAAGKIHPVKVLEALKECYDAPEIDGLPERCEDIYLIQELYLSTKDIGYQGVHKLKTSTDYLRKYIPEDGMKLSELIELNKNEK